MKLEKGDIKASAGMSKCIYDKLKEVLMPSVAAAAVDMKPVDEAWQKISYAIACGVIDHITSNMAIKGITTRGGHETKATSESASSGVSHTHVVPLEGVVFTQNNDGTGHVE